MSEEDIKNLNEIIELCEEEINNNDKNVTAILDLADLKSLRNLITRNRELEALKNSCPAIPTTGIECDLKKQLEEKDKEIISLSRKANEYKKAINCKDCDCCICEAHINTLELRAELEKKEKEIQFQKDINKTEKDRNKKTEKSLKGQIIKQNKIIDLMAEYLERFATFDVEKDEPLILIDKEDFKQYFEKKAEEDKQC